MATRNVLRLSATAVASFALLAGLYGCGGGGGSPAADPAPTVTIQSTVTSVIVTINDAPGLDGSTVTVTAIGNNGADLAANQTASAVWTIAETGNGATGIKVSTAGLLLNTNGTTHVVPVGKTVTVEATAKVGGTSKAAAPKVVTGACTAILTADGANCKLVGERFLGLSADKDTSGYLVVATTNGKLKAVHAFNGAKDGLPKAVNGLVHSTDYRLVNVVLLGGGFATYRLEVDGTFLLIDNVDHRSEPAYSVSTTTGLPTGCNGANSVKVGNACVANDPTINPPVGGERVVDGDIVLLFHGANSVRSYK